VKAARKNDRIVLALGPFETQVFERTVGSILRQYQVEPEHVDPRVAAVWYSTRGCRAAGMTEEEIQEWLHALHEFKSANLKLLSAWAGTLAASKRKSLKLELSLEESATLLSVLNDHRLWLAAQHQIGQAEMDLRSVEALDQLQPAQQFALYEIHLLAWIMEEILRATAPEAANWQ
jgi:hypothetical protein